MEYPSDTTAKSQEALDSTLSTIVMMRLARKNHQYSARPARPVNWANRSSTTVLHQATSCIRALLPRTANAP